LPFVGKVDVVWAANPDVVVIVPALVYGKVKRRPVAVNVDDLAVEDLFDLGLVSKKSFLGRFVEFVASFLYGRVELVTPISPGYVDVMVKRYGVNRRRICCLRRGGFKYF
jgi:colanic acid biosynthesis glycosyl transferase WcaI